MEKRTLHTVLSPRLLDLYSLSDGVVVVIDVFRATSTIATALSNGARAVYPVAGVEQCKQLGQKLGAITAGERNGQVIEGLLHGNSPAEYPRSFIAGKDLVLTTTNGTKLLKMALDQGAAEVITGSFVNLGSVCQYLVSSNKNVILACSGWKDRFNLEDTMFAGAVVAQIERHFHMNCDSSLMAKQQYQLHEADMKTFIRQTSHWHRLKAFGLEKDLEFCVTPGGAEVLPLYNPQNGTLNAVALG
ncbi:2-phosphosulfolactate phosphatase [Arachidicoccus rhizosphaerae]|uniref:Probable 2-phosphosulfolactate phosphatase n=1 Tax=Arachidicoccus rhizosphaerae TaxID=551991 RepID=A0A1H3WLN7_9BACT|nr:2-phosphosulfolactate phosphatase [Arachidicoccus rhizosphaerae]SDZ88033.1 2-phosphosulfolactate phosphatase [Arachidicoccus rhizosphaerae]